MLIYIAIACIGAKDTMIVEDEYYELKSKISGVYFNPKWNEEYSSTYVGLEITDLFSYPIHKFVKRNTKDKAFLIFEDKIVGYPNYKNKGIKTFP